MKNTKCQLKNHIKYVDSKLKVNLYNLTSVKVTAKTLKARAMKIICDGGKHNHDIYMMGIK